MAACGSESNLTAVDAAFHDAVPDAAAADAMADAAADARAPVELPAPTGSGAIGVLPPRLVVDTSRGELQTDDPDDARRILIQVWYPAEGAAPGARPPYMTAKEGDWVRARAPTAFPGWQDLVMGHARTSVPFIADGEPHPVLLFSHGLCIPRHYYVALIEEMVSHGYVVVAIAHLYDTAPVELADGALLELGPFCTRGYTFSDLDDHLAVWSGDAIAVLDAVEELAAGDPEGRFTDRLDLDAIGMFGHSYGGAASAEVAVRDRRIKAVANLDGTFHGAVSSAPVPVPSLLIRNHFDFSYLAFWMSNRGYDVTLAGAAHGSYTDGAIFRAAFDDPPPVELYGTIEPRRATAIIRAYLLAFFERQLRDRPAALLDGPTPYPEVTVVPKP